jgi:CHASE2 domain-containing sensor protein
MKLLRPDRDPLLKQLSPMRNKAFYVTLATFLALGYGLKKVDLISKFSGVTLDATMSRQPLPEPSVCRLVMIDAATLAEHFGSKIPVSPVELLRAVELLDKFRPAVIAVDFLTEDPAYKSLDLPKTNAEVVWAQGLDFKSHRLGPVLGREATIPGRFGPAVFFELDGMIRRYSPSLHAEWRVPTFAHSTVEAYCEKQGRFDTRCKHLNLKIGDEESYIRHFDDVTSRSFALFKQGYLKPTIKDYEGKIIILGGNYGDDVRYTSIGKMSGARLNAHAIESMLSRRLRDLPNRWEWSAKVLLGLAIALVYRNFMAIPAAVVLILLVAGSAVGSVYLLREFGYWPNIALFMMGIWIEQLYESHHVAQHDLQHLLASPPSADH